MKDQIQPLYVAHIQRSFSKNLGGWVKSDYQQIESCRNNERSTPKLEFFANQKSIKKIKTIYNAFRMQVHANSRLHVGRKRMKTTQNLSTGHNYKSVVNPDIKIGQLYLCKHIKRKVENIWINETLFRNYSLIESKGLHITSLQANNTTLKQTEGDSPTKQKVKINILKHPFQQIKKKIIKNNYIKGAIDSLLVARENIFLKEMKREMDDDESFKHFDDQKQQLQRFNHYNQDIKNEQMVGSNVIRPLSPFIANKDVSKLPQIYKLKKFGNIIQYQNNQIHNEGSSNHNENLKLGSSKSHMISEGANNNNDIKNNEEEFKSGEQKQSNFFDDDDKQQMQFNSNDFMSSKHLDNNSQLLIQSDHNASPQRSKKKLFSEHDANSGIQEHRSSRRFQKDQNIVEKSPSFGQYRSIQQTQNSPQNFNSNELDQLYERIQTNINNSSEVYKQASPNTQSHQISASQIEVVGTQKAQSPGFKSSNPMNFVKRLKKNQNQNVKLLKELFHMQQYNQESRKNAVPINFSNNNINNRINNSGGAQQRYSPSIFSVGAPTTMTYSDERGKILKRILDHFNIKIQDVEENNFMKIFGLEVQSIPPQNVPLKSEYATKFSEQKGKEFHQQYQQSQNSNIAEKQVVHVQDSFENVGQGNGQSPLLEFLKTNNNTNNQGFLTSVPNNGYGMLYPQLNYRGQGNNQIPAGSKPDSRHRTRMENEILNQFEHQMNTGEISELHIRSLTPSNRINGRPGASHFQINNQQRQNDEHNQFDNQKSHALLNSNMAAVDYGEIAKSGILFSELEMMQRNTINNDGTGGELNNFKSSRSYLVNKINGGNNINNNNSQVNNSQDQSRRRVYSSTNNSNQTTFKFSMGGDGAQQKEEIFQRKMNSYRDFVFKLNFSNNLFVVPHQGSDKDQTPIYRAYVGRGNNSALLKTLIKNRWWWTISDTDSIEETHFVWTQLKVNPYLEKLNKYHKILKLEYEEDVTKKKSKEEKIKIEKDTVMVSPGGLSESANLSFIKEAEPSQNLNQSANFEKTHAGVAGDIEDTRPSLATEIQNSENNKIDILNSSLNLEPGQINVNISQNGKIGSSQATSAVQIATVSKQIIPKQNNESSPIQNGNNNNTNQKKNLNQLKGPVVNNDPLQNIYSDKDCANFTSYIQENLGREQNRGSEDYSYRLKHLSKVFVADQNQIVKLQPRQIQSSGDLRIHNHFLNNWNLGNKKAMFYNMRQYYNLKKEEVFNFLPLTYHIQKGTNDKEFQEFLQFFNKRGKEISQQEEIIDNGGQVQKLRNIWIVKPGEITNRGNGITVCDQLREIQSLLNSQQLHSNGKKQTYIVQLYIDRPFLYNQRKFDIRCYMMMTCHNGIFRGYWFQEGYIRTSCREFTIEDCSDIYIHLTNDAIQQYADQYGKYEVGNQISFPEFQRYLDIWYPDCKYNFFTQIYPKLKNIASDAIKATFLKLDKQRRENTFEVHKKYLTFYNKSYKLFGLDFMIDACFQPWLIEINTNPSLEICCPLLNRLIPTLIEDTLRIGIDPLFPPPTIWANSKKHYAPDNLLENNKFQLIFDETVEGWELYELYQNAPNCLEGISELEEEEQVYNSDTEKKLENNETPKAK